jgi:hypothetical protein
MRTLVLIGSLPLEAKAWERNQTDVVSREFGDMAATFESDLEAVASLV